MRTVTLLPLFFLATPALAGSFTPPEGCTATLTVQSRGCYVSNFYTCEKDPKGDQWRADFDQEGVFFLSRTDAEAQWIESYDTNPTMRQTLDPNSADPASFSGLLATGYDSFVFSLTKDNGEHSNVHGFDKLTGKSFVIDGVTLQQTEYDYTETDDTGTVLRQSSGNEFIQPDWHTFLSGRSEWQQPDGTSIPLDGTPVAFIFPGEPGFAATQPLFDCSDVTSSLPQSLEVPSHDHL